MAVYLKSLMLMLSIGIGLFNLARAESFLSYDPLNQTQPARHCPVNLWLSNDCRRFLLPTPSDERAIPTLTLLKVEEDLKRVTAQLDISSLSAWLGFHPSIRLIEDRVPNAFATSNYFLIISTGLFDVATSLDELAYVVAHELGHMTLHLGKDPASRLALSPLYARLQSEIEADRFALHLLREKGFKTRAVLNLLTRLAFNDLNDFGPVGRPPLAIQNRLEVLELLMDNEDEQKSAGTIKEFMRKPDKSLEPLLSWGGHPSREKGNGIVH